MTLEVALIASNTYTVLESGWQNELDTIANDMENRWNSDLADSSSEEISIDTPLVSDHSDLPSDGIHTPAGDQTPEEFRDSVQNSLEYSTEFFDDFDSVLVRAAADMDTTGGIAYLGDTNNNQAAGSKEGVALIFDSSSVDIDPGIIGYHEILHTFAVEHSDGRRIPPGIFTGAKESVMCGNTTGCNDKFNLNPNQWETTSCTSSRLSDYVDSWGL